MPSNFYTPRIDHRLRLNKCMPAASDAHLGDVIYDLVNNHNALLTLLAGAGITGIDAATLAPLAVALPEDR